MATHTQVTDIVEKNDAANARLVLRLNEQPAHHDIGTARLIHNRRTEAVKLALKFFATRRKRSDAEIRPASHDRAR